jgi:hypothetical protein
MARRKIATPHPWPTDWEEYDRRVREYEDKGLTRSDAQGVVDAEDMGREAKRERDVKKAKKRIGMKNPPYGFYVGMDATFKVHSKRGRGPEAEWIKAWGPLPEDRAGVLVEKLREQVKAGKHYNPKIGVPRIWNVEERIQYSGEGTIRGKPFWGPWEIVKWRLTEKEAKRKVEADIKKPGLARQLRAVGPGRKVGILRTRTKEYSDGRWRTKITNRKKNNPGAPAWYVGVDKGNRKSVFFHEVAPTKGTHGGFYDFVVGPFPTRSGASSALKRI